MIAPPGDRGGLRFDRAVWPYMVARSPGTATAVEANQLVARLEPWLATRTSLLAMWIDDSDQPGPWFDESAVSYLTLWLTLHRQRLRDRSVAIAFVSSQLWKRKDLERQACWLEIENRIALDVFAQESAARQWLRAHAVTQAEAKRRGLAR
jgi:hypothetical protein